jgi:hypothetical protein
MVSFLLRVALIDPGGQGRDLGGKVGGISYRLVTGQLDLGCRGGRRLFRWGLG